MYKASAPGSLMLMGEHAVLHGHRALVCAVDKRISIELLPRTDKKIILNCSQYPSLTTDINAITIQSPWHFVLTTLQSYQTQLTSGCEISIHSQFSDQVGFGSSAAVTIALIAALSAWLDLEQSHEAIMAKGIEIIRAVQGRGSGADVAASVFGGVLAYQLLPHRTKEHIEVFPYTHAITALYAGYKTKTAEVIRYVEQRFIGRPRLLQSIYTAIGECVEAAITYLAQQDWLKFGEMMTVQQGLMASLGVNNQDLQKLIDSLLAEPGILGAKISGSGLGDCVIGLGTSEIMVGNPACIPVAMSLQGVCCE